MHFRTRLLLASAVLMAAASASAHTGTHAHAGFAAGLLHPLTGLDHLAAMLAVGAWSALAARPLWAAPAAFVLLLAVGALAGATGLAVPGVEPMIAASVLVIGLLVATRARLPLLAAGAAAGGFAFFHGAAHGVELAGGGVLPLAGMLLASIGLHLAGMALGRLVLARRRWLPLASGSALAGLGALMLVRLA